MSNKSEVSTNNDTEKNEKDCIVMEELQSSTNIISGSLTPVDTAISPQNKSDDMNQIVDESELANDDTIDKESISNEESLDKIEQTQNICSDGSSASYDSDMINIDEMRKKQIFSNDIVESVSIRENFQIRREQWDEAARTKTPEGLIPSELPSASNRRKSPPLSCMNRLHIVNWTNSSNRLVTSADVVARPPLNQKVDPEVEMFDVSDLDIQSMMEDGNDNDQTSSQKSDLITEFVSKSLSNVENNTNHFINIKPSSSGDEYVSFESVLSETPKLISREDDMDSEHANVNELDKIITGLNTTSLGTQAQDENTASEREKEFHRHDENKGLTNTIVDQNEKENYDLRMIKNRDSNEESDERKADEPNNVKESANEHNEKNNLIEENNTLIQTDIAKTNEWPNNNPENVLRYSSTSQLVDENVSVLLEGKGLKHQTSYNENDGSKKDVEIDNNEGSIEFSGSGKQNADDNVVTTATLLNENSKNGHELFVTIKASEALENEIDPTRREDDDASSQSLNSSNTDHEGNDDENENDTENELIMPNLSALVDDEEGDNFPLYADASTDDVTLTVQMGKSDAALQYIPGSPNQYSPQQSFHDEDSIDVFSASTNPVSNVTHSTKQHRYGTDHNLHEISPEDIVRPSASFESDIQDLVVESSDIPPPSPHSTTFPEKIECWGDDLNSAPQIPANEDLDFVYSIRVNINHDAQNIIDIEDIDGRPYDLEPELDEELVPRITVDAEPSLSMRVETSFDKEDKNSIEGSSMDEKRTVSTTESIELDDLQFSKYPHRTSLSKPSPLPNSDYVNDTGVIYTRVSWRSLFMKKWRRCVWLHYGRASLYLFRSEEDVNTWLLDQTLTLKERNDLIKVKFEFRDELSKPHVRGYKLTTTKKKAYDKNGPLYYNFKLEKWLELDKHIAAAFGSPDKKELEKLRSVVVSCLKNCPFEGLKSIKDLLIEEKTQQLEPLTMQSLRPPTFSR